MYSEHRSRAGPLGSAWLFQNLILERDAFRIVFLEPNVGSDLGRKDLRVILVAEAPRLAHAAGHEAPDEDLVVNP